LNPKFFRNGIVMLVLVVGTAALLFTWITSSSAPVTTGYSKFLGDVAAGQVNEVTQQGTTLTVKKDAGVTYSVTVPTILTDVSYESTVSNEETFGPLVIVEAVDTPENAVAVANRVQYGLTSTILAGDTYRAFELAPQVLHGIVNVNSPTVNDEIHAPMGGVRDSGWGRTGPDSVADFTDVIWINTTSSRREFPF